MGVEVRAVAMLLSFCSVFAGLTNDLFADISPDALLVLVNREHKIAYDYIPQGLVLPQVLAAPGKETAIYLRADPAYELEKMLSAAMEDGHTLYAVSGYRSYALQKTIYTRKVEKAGEYQRTVAPPGASEHQLGLAIDVNGESTVASGLVAKFGETPEGEWVYANAHRFGFIIRYPKDKTDITGYAWEPWHLRYVGKEAAEEIFALDITFEEYHAILRQRLVEAWIQQP